MSLTLLALAFPLIDGQEPVLASQALKTPPIGKPELSVEDYRKHVTYFASDELEGRESGREGGHMAARYAAKHFENLGLQPITKDGSFLVPFEVGALTCFNTAALLPGTDDELWDEILVIGGHHDHAGVGGPGSMGAPGQIHNGADDNASGSCGVLELAEYFAANPTKRPILFMTFSAEERGLNGSQAFVADGPIPVEHMRAMLNLDMIGRSRNGYLFLGGLGTAKEFHKLLDKRLKASKLDLELADAGEAPSDNTSFFKEGVPALFFFTHIHDDYHMPGDDIEKINFEGAIEILELVRDIAVIVNDSDSKITFVDERGMAMPQDFHQRMGQHYRKIQEQAQKRGRLGFTPGEGSEAGLAVDKVRSGSAAAKAGLKRGDTLISIDGKSVTSLDLLRRALGGKLKGEKITLEVLRGRRELTLEATLE